MSRTILNVLKFVTNIVMTVFLLLLDVVGIATGLVIACGVLVLPLLFWAMTPADMWKTFKALAKLAAIQVIGYKTFQLGDEPADVHPRVRNKPKTYVEFIADQKEFYALRDAANVAGLWFGYFAWTPLGKVSSKFIYSVWLVEKVERS